MTGLIEQTGATVRLWITGDSHHYARFAERWQDEDATPDTARRRRAPNRCCRRTRGGGRW